MTIEQNGAKRAKLIIDGKEHDVFITKIYSKSEEFDVTGEDILSETFSFYPERGLIKETIYPKTGNRDVEKITYVCEEFKIEKRGDI